MANLRELIKDHKDEICNGIAWVAIYKDGRSWQVDAFYPEGGDVEDGLVFAVEDYREMERIVGVDRKAIYLNGSYFGGLADQFPDGLKGLSLNKLVDEIEYIYEARLHQFKGDFLETMVVPPKTYDLYENKGLSAEQLREEYRGLTGMDNDGELSDEEVYEYMLEALHEKGDPTVEELIAGAAARSGVVESQSSSKADVDYERG